ncbi:hypothetical protein [Asticcacaulis excentricus]|uniref:Uncharacterized protein n=1 Tax=Asticcacaulis excentricus TaxID=78587 RepID=A0A3G9G6P4_9CAUL|nr:hypothetical protein [Asticcacaulis excentricus]BBF79909.1 hypothetical protein EM6_0486 [Asticcacaulis excentricus]
MESLFPMGLVPPSGSAEKKRGRPKGARNKAGGDLAKWFASQTGTTPGQQLIELVAVTPRDIRLAKAWAKDSKNQVFSAVGADPRAFAPRVLAMIYKADQFAKVHRCTLGEAWSMIFRGIDMLLPYCHQKQGSAEAEKPDLRPVLFVDGGALGQHGNPSQSLDNQQDLLFGPMPVTDGGSQIPPETVARQGFAASGEQD